MDRFNRTARQVRNADQRLIVGALTATLRPGPFFDYLHAEQPQSMEELQDRLASFIRIEEGQAHQRGREEGDSQSKGNRERVMKQPVGRVDRGTERRWGNPSRVQQYVHHTPLNLPRARVLEEALRADLMTTVQAPTPFGVDESKYCRYHQNRGHSTEDYVTLKDKLETLVQEGHLRRFVQRPSRPPSRGNRWRGSGNASPRCLLGENEEESDSLFIAEKNGSILSSSPLMIVKSEGQHQPSFQVL